MRLYYILHRKRRGVRSSTFGLALPYKGERKMDIDKQGLQDFHEVDTVDSRSVIVLEFIQGKTCKRYCLL